MNKKKFSTRFSEMMQIDYPVVGAPMFLVSDENLVCSMSLAGGLGTFPALNYRPIEKYSEVIDKIKMRMPQPFGINIIVQKSNKYQSEHLEIALQKKVPLLITSLGSPKEVIQKAHQVGTKVFCDVVGLEHAKKVQDLGADGVIAVSYGAGGHAGNISPFALIPELRKKLKIPVLAAGGISDGATAAAAFALGADGIYVGTRIIASFESSVSDSYKKSILDAQAEDILNTDRVDGFPGNFIRTESLERIGLEDSVFETIIKKSKKLAKTIALARAARSLFGQPNGKASYKTVFSAGHGVSAIEKEIKIADWVEETFSDCREILQNLSKI